MTDHMNPPGTEAVYASNGCQCCMSGSDQGYRLARCIDCGHDARSHGSLPKLEIADAPSEPPSDLARDGDGASEDQPDGIANDSHDLPEPERAAERVREFLSEFGDGIVATDCAAPLPPLTCDRRRH